MSPKKTALITGCSKGGVGDALAQEFHRNGIRVLATGRNLSKLEHLKALGIETLHLDVEDSESIKAAAKAAGEVTDGKLDFLVNNSGMGYNATVLDTDIEWAKKMYNVNFFGLIETIQAFAPQVIAAKGQIINVGSVGGILPIPMQGAYNSSKAAVHSISDALRVEMAPFGVKVICVVTGGIRSEFYKNCPDYSFPEDSLYDAAREALEPTMAGRSAVTYTPPEVYAKNVVRNSLSWWPSLWLWTGSESTIVWFVSTFLWHTALDSALARVSGLAKATSLLANPKK